MISRVAVAGHWIVWTDQSRLQGELAGETTTVRWEVRAKDLSTGRQKVLSSSGRKATLNVPLISYGDGYVAWGESDTNGLIREYLWKPGWPGPRTLFRHTVMSPGTESFSNGNLIYLGLAYNYAGHHTVGGNCGPIRFKVAAPPWS